MLKGVVATGGNGKKARDQITIGLQPITIGRGK